jgi:methionine-rich copper-binding protein CopC
MTLTGPSGPVKVAAPHLDGKSIAAAVQGTLPDGSYTASWQSAGDDGHAQKGEFKFTVKTK